MTSGSTMFARVVSQLQEYTGLRLPSTELANERAVFWAGKLLRTRQPDAEETSGNKLEVSVGGERAGCVSECV